MTSQPSPLASNASGTTTVRQGPQGRFTFGFDGGYA